MVGPPSFMCPGTLFPAKQTRQYRFGGALLPAPCLLSVPHPVQCGHPRLLRGQGWDRAQVREAGGNKWAFLFLLSVQSLSRVQLFVTPGTAAHQASLSFTNTRSPPKPMSIESVIPSNHLILCHPLLLLPSIFPSIGVFSNESVLPIRWPKYWSFSFSISPSNEYSGLISFWMDWLDLLAVQGTLKSLLQHHSSKHQFFSTQLFL